jgi:Na+/glutamate symporter
MMFIFNNDIKAYLFYDPNYVLYLMHRPWFRLPSYLMGLFAGLIVSRIHYSRYKVTIAFER